MDITNTHLEAALLDQKVAGEFRGKPYAFVPVLHDTGYILGVAVANEPGYSPITGKTFEDRGRAREWADGLNKHIGLSDEQAMAIVLSSMGKQPVVTV